MKRTEKRGFTIVELLTVMGVIAVLIGLLIPALNLVKDFSKEIQQKAQFHSIDVGLEIFKTQFGNYPESNDNSDPAVPFPAYLDNTAYCGANKLAEAMVGWDVLGFHPKSGFTADGYNDIDGDTTPELIYNTTNGIQSSTGNPALDEIDAEENIRNRKKFIDLENANAFQMQDIYTTYAPFNAANFVLCDEYSQTRQTGKKTGMPILYYRARTRFQFQDYTDTNTVMNDIYYHVDNQFLIDLGFPDDNTAVHTLANYVEFESMILNTQVQQATVSVANPNGIKRPYRADSYILISAGKDGEYGTADDITNFDVDTE